MRRAALLALLLVPVSCSSASHPSASHPPAALSPGPSPSSSVATSPGRPTPVQPGVRVSAAWPTYHGDTARSGYVPGGPDPRDPVVAWQASLDGKVYASPLIVGGQVLTATEQGSLYSLDAATGRVRWRRHLADPVSAASLPCGNIDPLGITGTPVYDPSSGLLYAVATQAGPRHVLYAVDAKTGTVRSQRDVDAPGSRPETHLQRAALLLSQGNVYVAFGGNAGDCGQYQGRVVAVPVAGGPLRSFSVPTSREAGIWAPSGPAALPSGAVFVTTGNGAATGGSWDRSDSLLRLSPALDLQDGFAPQGWAQENSADADLGSTGPLLLPGGTSALVAGKGGSAYLVDLQHLGGVGGQRSTLRGCSSYGGAAVGPDGVAFLPCSEGVLEVRVQDGALRKGWRAAEAVSGSPVVVGRTVWSLDREGFLHGLAASDGREVARLDVGKVSRFAAPAVSGNAVFVPTLSGITAVRLTP